MVLVMYDESFAGFLTAVFEVYEYKWDDVQIVKQSASNATIFGQQHTAQTDRQKAARVWKGLQRYVSKTALTALYHTWLSELPSIEQTLLQYIQYAFAKKMNVEEDFSNEAILMITKTARKVHRERHRMEAFVRFQLTKDALFYAVVEPDFNVLPLLINHFEKRYADQRWLIYDAKRKFGIHYDLEKVSYVQLSFAEALSGTNVQSVYDEKEQMYQTLWQKYFGSVNIKARKNTKLHIQHMPRRYWKYLPEKRG